MDTLKKEALIVIEDAISCWMNWKIETNELSYDDSRKLIYNALKIVLTNFKKE